MKVDKYTVKDQDISSVIEKLISADRSPVNKLELLLVATESLARAISAISRQEGYEDGYTECSYDNEQDE